MVDLSKAHKLGPELKSISILCPGAGHLLGIKVTEIEPGIGDFRDLRVEFWQIEMTILDLGTSVRSPASQCSTNSRETPAFIIAVRKWCRKLWNVAFGRWPHADSMNRPNHLLNK